MKYYKVVSRKSRKLFSAISSKQYYKCSPIRYIKNKWTFPKIERSRLFVFDDLQSAKNFAQEFSNLIVYECEALNPTKAETETLISSLYTVSPEEFWQHLRNRNFIALNNMNSGLQFVKENTVFCDAVMLTKKVSGEKGETNENS